LRASLAGVAAVEKSRTQRRRLFATRGVPRLQWAIFAAARRRASCGAWPHCGERFRQVGHTIELQMLANLERSRSGAESRPLRSSRRSRERAELHIHRAGSGPFAQNDINAESSIAGYMNSSTASAADDLVDEQIEPSSALVR